jgi:uncharacterized DUF497 family protein
MSESYHFIFDEKKNRQLRQARGLSFELMIALMDAGHVVNKRDHHNPRKYPNQQIIEIRGGEYMYIVPCVIRGNEMFLKTIYPSRKAVKQGKEKKHG